MGRSSSDGAPAAAFDAARSLVTPWGPAHGHEAGGADAYGSVIGIAVGDLLSRLGGGCHAASTARVRAWASLGA